MFHGSIPPLRSIVYEHACIWLGEDVYVGCSGNFTIERVLHARFGGERRVGSWHAGTEQHHIIRNSAYWLWLWPDTDPHP